jgi:hypothetical protein
MAIKAIAVDDSGTRHLIIGLNRENISSLLGGEIFILPSGAAPLNEQSDIVVIFAETDADLARLFPPALKPV